MQIIIFYTRKKCNFLFHLSPQSVKVVIHRGFTYGDRLIATYHQPINLSPSFPLINTLKKQVYFFYPPFHSSYLALILLGHHGREEKLPQLWQDISTSMTRSYHGRGDLTIPVSFVSIRPRACFSPSYNKVKSQTKHVWLLTLL